jgi:hypothetical protein
MRGAAMTRTRLRTAIAELERRGRQVKAVHFAADGGMTVLTETPELAVTPSLDQGSWVDLAGETDTSGAEGA